MRVGLLAMKQIKREIVTRDHSAARVPKSRGRLSSRLVTRGQESKDFKLLCSNGVAAVDDSALAVLQGMHPRLQEDLKLPQPAHTQDESSVFQRIFQEAALSDVSKDVFGEPT